MTDKRLEPDWTGQCDNCGQSPVVPLTGLCGPCTWGEAAMLDTDNWPAKLEQD